MSGTIEAAVDSLRQGKIIAYPTESVYGLGCDPFNEASVTKLLQLKGRSWEKGLILISPHFFHFENLILPVEDELLNKVWATWPGAVTWLFPATEQAPKWITGIHKSIAIRVTNHPIATKISSTFGKPIVSTSANREGEIPIRDAVTIKKNFPHGIDIIVDGQTGGRMNPSEIRDVITGKTIRRG